MNCLWCATGSGNEKKCRRPGCTNRMLTDNPPERCFAQCEAATGECRHFGAETRRVGCESCGGRVQIKVFACSLKGECTLGQPLDGIACCATCEDFAGKD